MLNLEVRQIWDKFLSVLYFQWSVFSLINRQQLQSCISYVIRVNEINSYRINSKFYTSYRVHRPLPNCILYQLKIASCNYSPRYLRMFYYPIKLYLLFQTIQLTSTHFREALYEKSFIGKKFPDRSKMHYVFKSVRMNTYRWGNC